MSTFYSNGKLLITAEYLVLKGAKALALPTKFGQSLNVFALQQPVISWKSYDQDGSVWYNDAFSVADVIQKKQTPSNAFRNTLIEILFEAHQMNPTVCNGKGGFLVETSLTFPRNWGLGTSSTLINNIAQWFEVDAFELLNRSFGGSGYDIACAQHATPIFYQLKERLPIITAVAFNPDFRDQLYFVYLNQKRSSKEAIKNFETLNTSCAAAVEKMSVLTEQIAAANDFEKWLILLKEHEAMMSALLQTQTVQALYFSDFDGVVKSLGAWGGDFVLVASKSNPTAYFKAKGYPTVLAYNEMIL